MLGHLELRQGRDQGKAGGPGAGRELSERLPGGAWNLPQPLEGVARSSSLTKAAKWSVQVQPGPWDPEVGISPGHRLMALAWGSMKRGSRLVATKSCMALVTLSPRRQRRTSSFWNWSRYSSQMPGKGSLQQCPCPPES